MNAERHQRVMNILADAMECDTGQRESLVVYSCAGDDSLQHEIERLLRYDKQAVGLIDGPVFEIAALLPLPGEEESLIGKQIGAYQIKDEIGRGGMGTVYLAARSDDEYQRQVAIKLINRGMDTTLILGRFRNERQILANLDHQHIVRLFDGGTTEDGLPFIVMEYIDGQPIDKYADLRKLSTDDRLTLFLSVCDAVQYAHANRVLHRDLKPGNILVTKEGLPKLLDFGIARVLHPNLLPATTESTLTALKGMTPVYASPEQLRGETVTTASDVYSLGVMLYELLTGHRPYNLRGLSTYEIARMVCEVDPEKPSTMITRVEEASRTNGEKGRTLTPESVSQTREAEPEQLRRRLAGDLDTVVLKALRKEPERRYTSVAQLAEDIRRHLDGLPILARQEALAYRSLKFLKRNRAYAYTALIVAVLCLLIGIWLSRITTPTGAARSIAVMPLVNVSQDPNTEYLADGLTEGLINRLSRLPNLVVPGSSSVFRYKGQTLDPRAIGHELGVKTVLTGRVTSDGNQLALEVSVIDVSSNQVIWTKHYLRGPSETLSLQEEVGRDVVLNLGLPVADEQEAQTQKRYPKDDESYQLYLRGNYFWNTRTTEGFIKAIDYYQRAIDRDPTYALAYDGLAKSYGLLGAYFLAAPEASFLKAKAAALKALELDPNLAEAHTTLALVIWLYDWDWAAADREFKRAIELNPQYVTSHHWYGLYLGEMGRAEESIAEVGRALRLDPISVPVNADLGRVYYFARRYDQALAQYQKTMEMDPGFKAVYAEFADLYATQKGMTSEWFSMKEKLGSIKKEDRKAFLAQDVEQFVRNEIKRSKGSPDWTASYLRAEGYTTLGENSRAFEELNMAFRVRDHRLSQLRVSVAFDSLRSDPRFAELLRRMNL